MKIRKAVITAAGWGTRFLPITKSQPKEMLPLVNKPIIQYSLEEAIACGAELVVVITSMGKRAIEDYLDYSPELEFVLQQKGETNLVEDIRRLSNMVDICYVHQKQQLGLGHAVLSAKKVVGYEPFVLLLPDDLFEQRERVLEEMLEIYRRYGSSVIATKRIAEEEISRYGIIEPQKVSERIYKVLNLVEKPQPIAAPSDMAIMGRYVLTPEIFSALEDTPPGVNGEIQLTDALKLLLKQQDIYAYEFEGEYYDVGTLLGWLETTILLALKSPALGPKLRDYLDSFRQQIAYPEKQLHGSLTDH